MGLKLNPMKSTQANCQTPRTKLAEISLKFSDSGIAALGFRNIFLATGYEPESFAEISGLAGVVGKDPPRVIGCAA